MYVHFEGNIPKEIIKELQDIIVVIIMVKIFFYYRFLLYDSLWKYAFIEELMMVAAAVIIRCGATVSLIENENGSCYRRLVYRLQLCRQITRLNPAKIIIIDIYENLPMLY